MSGVTSNREIELYITRDGEVYSPWWWEEIVGYFCALCGKKECQNCLVTNPWCG